MKFFIANWKMQLSVKGSVALAKKISKGLKSVLPARHSPEAKPMAGGSVGRKSVEVILCPSFDSLESVAEVLKLNPPHPPLKIRGGEGGLCLGAQDMFYKERGQFTGEESPLNLKELGVKYAILGHSERRKLGETDEDVNKKLAMALQNKLTPIVCVGETLKQRNAGQTKSVILKQINAIFQNVKIGSARGVVKPQKGFYYPPSKIIIAYEPVWAIGTGIFAKPEDVKEMREFIVKLLKKYLPPPHPSPSKRGRVREGERFAIIYGGSVDSKNISDFIVKANMEGALVGGASLKADEFLKIIKNSTKIC